MAMLWGMDRDLGKGQRWERMVRRYMYHQHEYNAFALTRDRLEELVVSICRKKIRFLKGYAGALEELARYLLATGVRIDSPLRAVFSEAESLGVDRRQTIESALGIRVTDIYGCREFGTIAAECGAQQGLHVNAEQMFVELEGNDLLVTSFMRRGTIFLRYAIGDMAAGLEVSPCACGRSSPRILDLLGRRSDNFMTKDGRVVHGEFVTHLLYGTRAIDQFQVVQKSLDHFVVRYVSGTPAAAAEEFRKLHHALDEHFGYPLTIDFEQLQELPKLANGKYRFTVSELTGATA
jgi:phenylacetate-CoA ligase